MGKNLLTNEQEIKLLQAYQNLRAFWYELKRDCVWLNTPPTFVLGTSLYRSEEGLNNLQELINRFTSQIYENLHECCYQQMLLLWNFETHGPFSDYSVVDQFEQEDFKDNTKWKDYFKRMVAEGNRVASLQAEILCSPN